MPPSAVQRDPMGELLKVTRHLDRVEATRTDLLNTRNRLICELLAGHEVGATRLARATGISTAAVYKIRDRALPWPTDAA